MFSYYFTVSGTTPTLADSHTIDNGSAYNGIDIIKVDSNRIFLLANDNVATDVQGIIVKEASGTLSNGTITAIFTTSTGGGNAVTMQGTDRAICLIDRASTNITTVVCELSDTTITANTGVVTETSDQENLAAATLDSNHIALSFEDDDDSSRGKTIIMKLDA